MIINYFLCMMIGTGIKVFNNESKSFSLITTPAHVSDYIRVQTQNNIIILVMVNQLNWAVAEHVLKKKNITTSTLIKKAIKT